MDEEELTEEELLTIYHELGINPSAFAAAARSGINFKTIAREWLKTQNRRLEKELNEITKETKDEDDSRRD